jgi:mono/diheme cytochrome c family protein
MRWAGFGLALALLSACGPKEDHNPLVTAPKDMQRFFLQTCSGCHFHQDHESGVRYGKWIRGAPTFYGAAWLERRSDSELANTIRNGIPGTVMPRFSQLKDDELQQIVQGILRPLSHRRPSVNHGFLEPTQNSGSACTERCL